MRLMAAFFAVLAVAVWWLPLPKLAQSVDMLFLAVTILALRSAWQRLDKVNRTAREIKETLREVRDGSKP